MVVQLSTGNRLPKCALPLAWIGIMACAGFLAGCGVSSDREVETGLVERQVGGWKPTSASPAKENEAAPRQLSQVADKYMSANKPGNGAWVVMW